VTTNINKKCAVLWTKNANAFFGLIFIEEGDIDL